MPAGQRALALVAAALVSVAAAPAPAHAVTRHTLPELVRIARARSANVALAEAQLHVADEQLVEVRRLLFPTGEFRYLLTGAPRVECRGPNNDSDPTTRTRDCVNTVDPTAGQANVSYLSTNLAGVGMQGDLSLTQPLFTFGKISNAIEAARHGAEASRAGVEAARDEAELLVTRAYWGLKFARAAHDTVADARERLAPWVEKLRADQDAASPKYSDDDRARLDLALYDVDSILSDLERSAASALAGLRAIAGDEADVDTTELSPVDAEERSDDDYVAAALLHRPELRQADAGVAALSALARVRRGELLPDLALVGGLSFRYTPTVEDATSAFVNHANYFGYGLFLALRMPLDIPARLARWEHARADVAALEAQKQAGIKLGGFDIRRVHADLAEARRRLAIWSQAQRRARGWFLALDENVALGTAEPRVLVEAARAYFERRLKYFQAIMDVNVNTAQLRRLVGGEAGQ